MASRQLAIKHTRLLAAKALKCGQRRRVTIQTLGRVCTTSVASERKDGSGLPNRTRPGGRLCQRENYLPLFTAFRGTYYFTGRATNVLGAPISTRRLHSASDCSEHRVRDPSTRQVRVRSESDPLFARAYQDLLAAVTDIDPHEPALQEVLNACRKGAEYNLPGGKRNRLFTLVYIYELLAEESRPHLEQACLLGWCMELLQSSSLMMDDIMDGSPIRRGRPCWYTLPGVGLRGINDSLFLERATRRVIDLHLGHLPCHQALTELFHEYELRMVLGQCLDMGSEKLPLDQFNPNHYWTIVTYKTAIFSFVLHTRAGMVLAGLEDPVLHGKAEQAALHLGRVYQVQDDFLDAFGDPSTMGKVGMDIVGGKYTWLAVKAVQLASPAQRAVLEANFGKGVSGGPEEAAVKAIYEELDLRGHFAAYEKTAFDELDSQIRDMPEGLATAFRFMRDANIGRKK